MRHPGVYKRGRVWWIKFYDQFGKRRYEPAGTDLQSAIARRVERLGQVRKGTFTPQSKVPAFGQFVDRWRAEVASGLKPSTRAAYESILTHHLVPRFGTWPLNGISKAAVRAFITEKAGQQRWDYTKGKKPNPTRPTLSPKTIKNMIGVMHTLLESARDDYELLGVNPLAGILSERRRRRFPTQALRPRPRRAHVLQPEEFLRAVALLEPKAREMVLVAALAGLRWGEQVALRVDEDVDLRRNVVEITRALYKRSPQTPKTRQSERNVKMSPLVRRVMQRARATGFIFSKDGVTPLSDGPWVKRQWRRAQLAAGIRIPMAWHDLRHQFVSFLIAIGKHPKYIADQAGHRSAGFTMDHYGHLFDEVTITPREWPEDLLYPAGIDGVLAGEVTPTVPATVPMRDRSRPIQTERATARRGVETQ